MMRSSWRRALLVAAWVPMALMVCATTGVRVPAQEAAAPAAAGGSTTFVSRLKSAPDSARLAIVTDGKALMAYVCSGDDAFNAANSGWFKGPVGSDGRFEVKNATHTLKGAITGTRAEGTVSGPAGEMAFATAVDADGLAGLFRAEDDAEDGKYVFGWVIDQELGVVGSVRPPKGNPAALKAPANGVAGGVKGQAGKSNPVQGQKVNDPANPPKGQKGSKFDDAKRTEIRNELVAKLGKKGGSPLQAMVLHQMRRFVSGAKAATDVEERTFAVLRRTPRPAIVDYLKNWDALPKGVRDSVLPAADQQQLQPNAGLAAATVRTLAGKYRLGQAAPATPPAGSQKTRSITANQIEAVDISEPERFLGVQLRDEVFVTYTVAAGPVTYSKQTKVYTGFVDGTKQGLTGTDNRIFPPDDQPGLTTADDVLVIATMLEDDSGGIPIVTAIVKAVVDLTLVIVSIATGQPVPAALAPAINEVIDATAAAFPTSQVLGADALIFRANGQVLDASNQPRNPPFFRVRKTTNGAGGPYDYRLNQVQFTRQ